MRPLTRREMIRTAAGAAALSLTPALLRAADEKKGGEFSLPKLPYSVDALEPHIDAKTMEIHHGRHHKTYVDNLNKALAGTGMEGKPIEEILTNLKSLPEKLQAQVRNNGGGHYNHTLFWNMMSPKGGRPAGALLQAINASFGDLEGMLKALKQAALTRFGSGWGWVVVGGKGKEAKGPLTVTSTANQDNPILEGAVAILGVDVWEHAYYLKYQNKRADYLEAWTNVINWEFVGERFASAGKK